MKAGASGACTVQVCKQGAKKRDLDISCKAGRLGHGVALFFVEPPSIATQNPTIVDQNMVITVDPGLAREDDFFKPRRMFWEFKTDAEFSPRLPEYKLWTLG